MVSWRSQVRPSESTAETQPTPTAFLEIAGNYLPIIHAALRLRGHCYGARGPERDARPIRLRELAFADGLDFLF